MLDILVDTREQHEWEFKGYNTIHQGLTTGDYSIRVLGVDYDNEIAIERKELEDFIACCGSNRDRFIKELERAVNISHFFIIIEGDWKQIESHAYRSQINPESVIGSIISWQMKYGVHIILAGNRERSKYLALKIFETFARHKFKNPKDKTKIDTENYPSEHSETSVII